MYLNRRCYDKNKEIHVFITINLIDNRPQCCSSNSQEHCLYVTVIKCVPARRCVNSQEPGAVFLHQEVGQLLKDWLAVQGDKLFPTHLTGGERGRQKCTWSYSRPNTWPTSSNNSTLAGCLLPILALKNIKYEMEGILWMICCFHLSWQVDTWEKEALFISVLVAGFQNHPCGTEGFPRMWAQQGFDNVLPQLNESLYVYILSISKYRNLLNVYAAHLAALANMNHGTPVRNSS